MQCRDLGVRITLHSGHTSNAEHLSSNSWKSMSESHQTYPGSLKEAKQKLIIRHDPRPKNIISGIKYFPDF